MEALSRGSVRLRLVLKTPWAALRNQKRCYGIGRHEKDPSITPVASTKYKDYGAIGIPEFKLMAFGPEEPLLMNASPLFVRSPMAMPAINKWFDFATTTRPGDPVKAGKVMSTYLRSFSSTTFLPYELAYPQTHQLHGEAVYNFIESLRQGDGHNLTTDKASASPTQHTSAGLSDPSHLADLLESQTSLLRQTKGHEPVVGRPRVRSVQRILHFTAPLALLDAAVRFNGERPNNGIRNFYVAQAPINDLPKELQDDLPVPGIVKNAGRGDIYDSSIWLGLEPTYTPLHRDPNPNLFIQLCGNKVVRLLPPASGDQLYRDVQFKLGHTMHVKSRLRGPEMMDGPERDLMYRAVWYRDGLPDREAPEGLVVANQGLYRSKMQEATLRPGDALFIPKGWWHSVKSEDDAGRLNASVNWWFR